MEKNFSKIQSKYLFYAKWTNNNAEEKAIAVILSIDYKSQTFSITPENASNDKFAFIGGNKETTTMWYAVTEAIIEANNFARKELGFE
jgi:hypothetical protein